MCGRRRMRCFCEHTLFAASGPRCLRQFPGLLLVLRVSNLVSDEVFRSLVRCLGLWSDVQMSYRLSIFTSLYCLCHLWYPSYRHRCINIYDDVYISKYLSPAWTCSDSLDHSPGSVQFLLLVLDIFTPQKHSRVIWKHLSCFLTATSTASTLTPRCIVAFCKKTCCFPLALLITQLCPA